MAAANFARRVARRIRRQLSAPATNEWTMRASLERHVHRHGIRSVIDVGASDGSWSMLLRPMLPSARYLLIEAQAEAHEAALAALKGRHPRFDYVCAAAGDREGTIHFDGEAPLSGAASETSTGAFDRMVPMTTIDLEVARRRLEPPYLVKLDTHGFEAQILDGATATLKETALLVVEVYNFELRPGVLRFHELCAYVESRHGLRCIDVADPMHRPKDGVLWQVDMVFAQATRPEFADDGYG